MAVLCAPSVHAESEKPSDAITAMVNPWAERNDALGAASRVGPYSKSDRVENGAIELTVEDGTTSMDVLIWTPQTAAINSELPFVIISGWDSIPPETYQVMASHLASHGYVVIAPRHPAPAGTASKTLTSQARIDDVHRVLRMIPRLSTRIGLFSNGEIACLGFHIGVTDCLMNAGISTPFMGLHPWNGHFTSLILTDPQSGSIPTEYAAIQSPIMVVGSMEAMGIENGLLARHPPDSFRFMVAIQGYNEPFATMADSSSNESFFWRGVLAEWLYETMGKYTTKPGPMGDPGTLSAATDALMKSAVR